MNGTEINDDQIRKLSEFFKARCHRVGQGWCHDALLLSGRRRTVARKRCAEAWHRFEIDGSLVGDTPPAAEPTTPSPKLRVWWIPQVPGARFFVDVADVAQAKLVLGTLARYDAFQLEQRIKPDYANVGGLEVFENADDEWIEWCDEDGDDIATVLRDKAADAAKGAGA